MSDNFTSRSHPSPVSPHPSPVSPHPSPLPEGEGARGEGARGEGVKGEGVKGEGVKGEGVKGEGVKGEGVREAQFQSPLSPGERGLGGEGATLAGAGAISHLAGINRRIPEALLQRARELRKKQTSAEKLLWQCLRNRQLFNAKFRRQHNIDRYIADFYCHEARLVVELDGSIHETRKTEDSIRDDWMQANGFTVLRFPNQEVFNNTEQVLYVIADALTPAL